MHTVTIPRGDLVLYACEAWDQVAVVEDLGCSAVVSWTQIWLRHWLNCCRANY